MLPIKEHLVIIRTGASLLNLKSYNCQELGLAKSLAKKGLKVSLVLAGENEKKLDIEIDGHTISIYFVKYISLNQALGWFFKIETLLRNLQPTCIQIHEFGMFMSYRVLRWAKTNNVKTVLIQGSYQTTQKPFFKQLEILFNRTLGQYIIKNVNAIGCKSFMASKYVKRYVDRPTKLTCVGLDTDKFHNNYHSINWKEKLDLSNKKVLLYVGIFEPRRNPLFLVKVAKQLSDEFVLIMTGRGILEKELKTYITKYKLEHKIKLTGQLKQEDLPSLYQAADLFLLASDYEIYGMVILEAMYFGLPIITTRTAGSEVLINNNSDGIILNNKQEDTWAKTIQGLFSTPNKINSMKKNAANKIINNFVWDKSCEQFLQLYNLNI